MKSLLPAHGRVDCADCFPSVTNWGGAYERDGWRLERNPCAWGSDDPIVLVLGFSKGVNQTRDLIEADGRGYNAVPFRSMRNNLTAILRRLSLLAPHDDVDRHINAEEKDIA